MSKGESHPLYTSKFNSTCNACIARCAHDLRLFFVFASKDGDAPPAFKTHHSASWFIVGDFLVFLDLSS